MDSLDVVDPLGHIPTLINVIKDLIRNSIIVGYAGSVDHTNVRRIYMEYFIEKKYLQLTVLLELYDTYIDINEEFNTPDMKERVYEFIYEYSDNMHLFGKDVETLSYLLELFLRKNDKRLVDILCDKNELRRIVCDGGVVRGSSFMHRRLHEYIYDVNNLDVAEILIKKKIMSCDDLYGKYLRVIDNEGDFEKKIEIILAIFSKYKQKFSDISDENTLLDSVGCILRQNPLKDYNWIDSVLMFITDGRIVTEEEFKKIINYDRYHSCCALYAIEFFLNKIRTRYSLSLTSLRNLNLSFFQLCSGN